MQTVSVLHRRERCQQQVGEGFLCLHQAGLPHQLAPTARYWRHLWYHADSMDHMRWWKGGSGRINNSAEQVFDFPGSLILLLFVPGKSRSGAWSIAAALTACSVALQADVRALEDGDVPGATHSTAGSITCF